MMATLQRGGSSLPSLDQLARFWLPTGAAAVATTVLLVGWFTQPDRYVRGFAPMQPIPFSHRLHAGEMAVPCQYCHSAARRSRHAMVPAADTCMNCHRVTRTDRSAIRRLASLEKSGNALRWRRIHVLPDYVYFDHRPHVLAGILCQTCHGEVEEMEVVSQHMSMRMGNCLGCHRDPRAALPVGSPIRRGPDHCDACHR
jgi:hypothetical protein